MTDYVHVCTTTGSETEACQIATALVERRLAACVQIQGPIKSIYRWQGNVEQADEWLCTAKTNQRLFTAIAEAIRALHSYECPEIIATPLVALETNYATWLQEQLKE